MLKFNLDANTIRKETDTLNSRNMADRALNKIYCSLFNFRKYAEVYIIESEFPYTSQYFSDKGITLIKTIEPCIYKAELDPDSKEGKQTLDSIEMSKQTILDNISDSISRSLKECRYDAESVIEVNNFDVEPDFSWLINIIESKNFKIEICEDYNFSKGNYKYIAKVKW